MKVLIISHNPITTYHNMGKTFMSLFSAFEREELCQLYIYPTLPDVDICHSYYRMTDRDVLNSYFHFGKLQSRVITTPDIDIEQHVMFETDEDAAFLKRKKKNPWTIMARDLMWACAHWYNDAMKRWLAEEKPTCIFLAPGESMFIYAIASKIAEKLDIPIYTYICDEYYFVQQPVQLSARIQLALLRHRMKKVLQQSRGIITICDELARLYRGGFGTTTHTILTGSTFPVVEQPLVRKNIRGLTFMGNMGLMRYRSLAHIGRALDIINKKNGSDLHLFLYGISLKAEVRQAFADIQSICYRGYVTGADFEQTLHDADVLVHVEAFDSQAIDRVKHSVSTKIADCLASGHLLFAYGPAEVASMQHLIRNQCAAVATDLAELQTVLEHLLFETNHETIIQNGLKTAHQYHSSEKNSKRLYEILNGRA